MQQQFSTPLCVDLDGTLVETNTLFEAGLTGFKKNPFRIFALLLAALKGKAHVKHLIGEYTKKESFIWPYNSKLLAFLRMERAKGRSLILTTASDHSIANKVAEELGIFDEVIANTITEPVSASLKYQLLKERFGEKGFSYAGNSHADISVWNIAASAILVHTAKDIASHVRNTTPVEAEFPSTKRLTLKDVLREIRVHQWLKNLLLFVPPIMAHRIGDPGIIFSAIIGFFSFSFLASSMYVMNDLLDIPSDRAHATKRMRPIAFGTISAFQGVIIAVLLAASSFLLADVFLPFVFLQMLLIYIIINTIYTLRVKKIPYLDIIILAGLYVLRIVAGSAATGVATSVWLFFFAGCFFFYLASVKRVTELLQLANRTDSAPGRGYTKADTELLVALGLTFALLSCIVLGLYIGSKTVIRLYDRPEALWAIIPLLSIWIIRMGYITLKKQMPDDPVLFTSKDRVSYGIALAIFVVFVLAGVK